VVFDKIIIEVKAVQAIANEFIALAINYLKVSQNKLALIANFGEFKLYSKLIVLDEKIEKWEKRLPRMGE
jgi:GxxExxY protein